MVRESYDSGAIALPGSSWRRDPFKSADWAQKHVNRWFITIVNTAVWAPMTGETPPLRPAARERLHQGRAALVDFFPTDGLATRIRHRGSRRGTRGVLRPHLTPARLGGVGQDPSSGHMMRPSRRPTARTAPDGSVALVSRRRGCAGRGQGGHSGWRTARFVATGRSGRPCSSKAADVCAFEPERAARSLVEKGVFDRYDYAL
jgi:hypothetical protein